MTSKEHNEPRPSCNPWELEDAVVFVDTDRDTDVFRLVNGVVHLEVNGRRLFNDVITCRIDGRTLHLQTADAKIAVLTVPRGNEEVVLRVVALLGRRYESDNMVEFLDTDGDMNLFRLVPGGCLELFINGRQCMYDVTSCRFDGPTGRKLHLKGSPSKAKFIMTISQQQDEALQRVLRIFSRRGMRENAVEFLDTRGDAYAFRLNSRVGTLELHINGRLCESDLSDLRGEGLDGRRLHYNIAGSRTPTAITLPAGAQELALAALALFRRRTLGRSSTAPSVATFCLCPSLDEKPPAGEAASTVKGTTVTEEDRASSSASLESALTHYSALSTAASTGQFSAEPGAQQSAGHKGAAFPCPSDSCTSFAKMPSDASGRRTLVRDWLLRKPRDSVCGNNAAKAEQRLATPLAACGLEHDWSADNCSDTRSEDGSTKVGRSIHWLVP